MTDPTNQEQRMMLTAVILLSTAVILLSLLLIDAGTPPPVEPGPRQGWEIRGLDGNHPITDWHGARRIAVAPTPNGGLQETYLAACDVTEDGRIVNGEARLDGHRYGTVRLDEPVPAAAGDVLQLTIHFQRRMDTTNDPRTT